MLSYILGVVFRFERIHGYTPRLLYLSREHIRRLCIEVGMSTELELSGILGLQVVGRAGIVQPRVFGLIQTYSAAALIKVNSCGDSEAGAGFNG